MSPRDELYGQCPDCGNAIPRCSCKVTTPPREVKRYQISPTVESGLRCVLDPDPMSLTVVLASDHDVLVSQLRAQLDRMRPVVNAALMFDADPEDETDEDDFRLKLSMAVKDYLATADEKKGEG